MGSPNLLGRSGDREIGRNYGTILTTPEQIVREFRIAGKGIRVESVRQPISKLERAIRIFLLITLGWAIGYLHHFLAMK